MVSCAIIDISTLNNLFVGLLTAGATTSSIVSSQCLYSPNSFFRLCLKSDGNLVGYDTTTGLFTSTVFWSTNTSTATSCSIQTSGNFVCYNQQNAVAWSTETSGKGTGPSYTLAMQNDRNIVIYDVGNNLIWSSNTGRMVMLRVANIPNACLDIPNNYQVNGQTLHQVSCNSQNSQQFLLAPTNNGAYTIISTNGLCLDVNKSLTSNGAALELLTCNSHASQKWLVNDLGSNLFKLQPSHTLQHAMCLDAANTNTIQIWNCTRNFESWSFSIPVSSGTITITFFLINYQLLFIFINYVVLGILRAGTTTSNIVSNQCLYSPNGLFRLCLQTNGNLVGYDMTTGLATATVFWSTGTSSVANCSIQTSGNFVCNNQQNTAVWSTGTSGKGTGPSFTIAMQNDRNVAIYDQQHALVWATNTSIASLDGTWSNLNIPDGVKSPLLMTDGSVILIGSNGGGSNRVWKITPDSYGNYKSGSVTQVASMPPGYCPGYYASATLPDGRIVIVGGEYMNCGGSSETNLGAIYDPIANVWTLINPPAGCNNLGDINSIILPDGTFMVQDFFDSIGFALNVTSLTWTKKLFSGIETWFVSFLFLTI